MGKVVMFCFLASSLFSMYSQYGDQIISIEYRTGSRGGGREHIIIKQDSLFYQSENASYHGKLQRKEWAMLLKTISDVSIATLPELKSPSMKRLFDGAKHSEITIVTENNSYSHSFDDDDPHESLQKLLGVMKEVAAKNITSSLTLLQEISTL